MEGRSNVLEQIQKFRTENSFRKGYGPDLFALISKTSNDDGRGYIDVVRWAAPQVASVVKALRESKPGECGVSLLDVHIARDDFAYKEHYQDCLEYHEAALRGIEHCPIGAGACDNYITAAMAGFVPYPTSSG